MGEFDIFHCYIVLLVEPRPPAAGFHIPERRDVDVAILGLGLGRYAGDDANI